MSKESRDKIDEILKKRSKTLSDIRERLEAGSVGGARARTRSQLLSSKLKLVKKKV